MNKVVAILGIIVLLTIAGLFFCVGFFTGTTIFPSKLSLNEEKETEKSMTLKDVEEITDVKSATVSEKVRGIISSAAETAGETLRAVKHKGKNLVGDSDKVTLDSLLREITAGHSNTDDCSVDKTATQNNAPPQAVDENLKGKKIAFIGYFKNNVVLQIQKLLSGKGYKTHVVKSKRGDGGESFVFCGPFKNEENAKNLVVCLQKHDFHESKVISVSDDSTEETLYDMNDDPGLPTNAEKDIPEIQSITPIVPPVVPPTTQVTSVPPTIPPAVITQLVH